MEASPQRPWLTRYPEGVRPQLAYPSRPLQSLLDDAAARFPAGTATQFYGGRLTWGEVQRAANAFAAALAAMGVRKGDRVAIMLPNVPQGVIAYYGALKAGAVVVFCNPLYVERELEHQLKDAGAEVLLVLDLLYERVRNVRAQTALRKVIVTGLRDYMGTALRLLVPLVKRELVGKLPPDGDLINFKDLLRRYDGWAPPHVEIDPERDLAVLQYTGGTTGLSKGAMLTHRNLMANVTQVREWMPGLHDGAERFLTVMPFFHVYGLTVCLNMATLLGATLILVPKFDLKQVLQLIDKQQPTIFPGAPPIYVAINNCSDVGRYNLRSVKACISGAAPLPVEVQATFEQLTGGKLVEGYGLTEASPVTHCTPIYGRRVAGSIGLPLSDTEMKIVDLETGEQELAPGEVGELCIRGPQVMAGYWNRPEETAKVLRDGWLYTGDIARVDKDGYTYIVDRAKDMIIAGGFNIYPREVEEVLYEHPAILEAAVAGLPDEYRGQTVKAYVVLKPGPSLTEDELIGWCRERMAKYKAPTLVEFRESLPKTMIGKVLRRVLLEEEQQREAAR
ncbi:MAG TPA: long-chain fatty acid--CoA ligase [Symbiobacteriaceae bacterium]|nr:long-chain fatty acid--CoA ligase [Symbiobacteriaceae bacterium]